MLRFALVLQQGLLPIGESILEFDLGCHSANAFFHSRYLLLLDLIDNGGSTVEQLLDFSQFFFLLLSELHSIESQTVSQTNLLGFRARFLDLHRLLRFGLHVALNGFQFGVDFFQFLLRIIHQLC